jgi:hypothetical protein
MSPLHAESTKTYDVSGKETGWAWGVAGARVSRRDADVPGDVVMVPEDFVAVPDYK